MINVALLGNPNVGKTTVFNSITGLNQHVGNWAGVTVEKKEGFITNNIKVTDLPGIYAMDTYSNEEKISKNFLETGDVDVILNVVDGSNLSRNLYLTTQLMKFNKPIILLVNMLDIAKNKGFEIDYKKLANLLGVTVIPMIAKKENHKDKIKASIEKVCGNNVNYKNFSNVESETYAEIESILSKSTTLKFTNKKSISDKIDSIVLNKFLAYPIFLVIIYILFQFTFGWVGKPIQDLIQDHVSQLADIVSNLMSSSSPWFRSLIVNGLINSLGSAISFFPLIFVLFFGLSLFEDSGYMARVAFLMDNLMKKVGLSGKAFIPMVMGFGCSSPAIMATRTLDNEYDRKITALVSPLITCSARLPIYALFVAIFFPKNQALITTVLYVIGIVMAILVSLFLKNTRDTSTQDPFILELPNYNLPTASELLKNTWEKSQGFLRKVTTVMFAMSVIIWALSSFGSHGYTSQLNNSILALLGKIIAPIFNPLGFGDWRAGVSILSGLGAKEVVITTMRILYGNVATVLPTVFTVGSSFAFLIFSSLYTPCIAALSTMQKEYGRSMMIISFLYQFALAWVAAFYVNSIGSFIFGTVTTKLIVIFLVVTIIVTIFLYSLHKYLKNKSKSIDEIESKLKRTVN